MKKGTSETRRELILRLGYLRDRAKLSARMLSAQLDKSVAYIAKYENGDFDMPSESLLEAIEICGSTPEEFFFRNIHEYVEVKEVIDMYERLSAESKQTIKDLMKNMK